MAQIFLDENDVVRFDGTADQRMANAAAIGRDFLKMASLLERLAQVTGKYARRNGRSNAVHTEVMSELRHAKAGIRADARSRFN